MLKQLSVTSAATLWTKLKSKKKAKEITEDELKTLEKDIQKVTDDAVKHIDDMTANKEKKSWKSKNKQKNSVGIAG